MTCMGTSNTRWAVVMSRNAGFVVSLEPLFSLFLPLFFLPLQLTFHLSLYRTKWWSLTSNTPLRGSIGAGIADSGSQAARPLRTRPPSCSRSRGRDPSTRRRRPCVLVPSLVLMSRKSGARTCILPQWLTAELSVKLFLKIVTFNNTFMLVLSASFFLFLV